MDFKNIFTEIMNEIEKNHIKRIGLKKYEITLDEDLEPIILKPMKVNKSGEFLFVLKNNKVFKDLFFKKEKNENEEGKEDNQEVYGNIAEVISEQYDDFLKLIKIGTGLKKSKQEIEEEFDHIDLIVLFFAIVKVNFDFLLTAIKKERK